MLSEPDVAVREDFSCMVRVTIGMPVYQAERYLAEAIESHLNQTFGDFVLFISDNGSTDRTAQIAQDFAARDSRVRYQRHEENRGAIWNLNHVAQGATTEYFKWSAHDDLLHPTFLERTVNYLDQHSETSLCFSRVDRIDASSRSIPESLLTEQERDGEGTLLGTAATPSRRFRDVLLGGSWGIRSNGLLRVAHLQEIRPLLPLFGSEKVVVAELMLRGKYHEFAEQLFRQRIHAEQSSSLSTAAEQQQFCDPRRAKQPKLHHVRFARAYCSAIRRAPITWMQKLGCAVWLFRYLLQLEKWWGLVSRKLRGKPLPGGSRALLARLEQAAPHPDSFLVSHSNEQTSGCADELEKQVKFPEPSL